MPSTIEVKRFPIVSEGIHAVRHTVGELSIDAIVTELSQDEIIRRVVEYKKQRDKMHGYNGGGTYATNGNRGSGYIDSGESNERLIKIFREGLAQYEGSLSTSVWFDYGSRKEFALRIGKSAFIVRPGVFDDICIHREKDNQFLVKYSFKDNRSPFPDEVDFLNSFANYDKA